MPSNKKGGKNYKKGKKDESAPEYIDIQPGQFMARAIRILGDRNVMCYCHDNVVRICHISRRMKGMSDEKRIEIGDILLTSLREFNAIDVKAVKRGDILAKYTPEQVRDLRKEGLYPKLFLKVEEFSRMEAGTDLSGSNMLDSLEKGADDGFEFEKSEAEDSESEETQIVDKRDKVNHRAGGRVAHEEPEKEINIDHI
jgi:initiation factor 1A